MQRIVCTQWGPPEELVLVEQPDPVAGEGQVVVAGGRRRGELRRRPVRGRDLPDQGAAALHAGQRAGRHRHRGRRRGGPAPVGDRVLSSLGLGAFASHVVVPARSVTPDPRQARPTPPPRRWPSRYCTAWFALTRRTTVRPARRCWCSGPAAASGWPPSTWPPPWAPGSSPRRPRPRSWPTPPPWARRPPSPTRTEDLKARARELSDGQRRRRHRPGGRTRTPRPRCGRSACSGACW
jgi:hypothetical protein